MTRDQTRQLLIVGTAAVAAGLVVAAVVNDARPGRFQRRSWKLAPPDADDRLDMAEDLLQRGRLEGLRQAQVEKLLGPPTPTDRFPGAGMAYRLGLERSYMPVDHEWLVIHFDDAGRVSRCWVATD